MIIIIMIIIIIIILTITNRDPSNGQVRGSIISIHLSSILQLFFNNNNNNNNNITMMMMMMIIIIIRRRITIRTRIITNRDPFKRTS